MAGARTYFPDTSNFSQADQRSFRVFRDQHGRQWQGMVENKTQHPTGPLSRKFKAPLNVPMKYLRITDAAAGQLEIDYDTWIKDLHVAHELYNLTALEEATKMFGDKGPQAVKDNDVALLRRIGRPPEKIERVMAAKAGNRWVLGLANPKTGLPEAKPKWADEYFPAPVEPKMVSFPNADEEFPDADQETAEIPTSFPARKVANYWWLNREHFDAVQAGTERLFRGTEEEAIQSAALREGEVPAGAHESWGG